MSKSIQAYQLRSGGVRARMAILRNQSANWRSARSWKMNNYESAYCSGLHSGANGSDKVWYSHGGEQFRNERDAHDVTRLRHTGWFTDTDGRETVVGIVASLPHGRFIAGYRWTSNDERVYYGEIFDDEDDAARMADEHARVFSESAMEDSERFDAARSLEEDIEDALQRLRECLALRNHRCFGDMRAECRRLAGCIRKLRDELAGYAEFI